MISIHNGQCEVSADPLVQRARALLDSSLVIDLVHPGIGGTRIYESLDPERVKQAVMQAQGLDGLLEAYLLPYELGVRHTRSPVRDWWDQSGVTVASYFDVTDLNTPALETFVSRLQKLTDSSSWLRFARSGSDMRCAKTDGAHAFFLYCQPMSPIPRDLTLVEQAYKLGLRMLMLTYNRMDLVGTGCMERVDAGLSRYGIELVERCNELGIVIDTAHCSPQTTFDACRFSRHPVCSSHCCSSTVYPHPRNKSDAELLAVARTGGVIGISMVPDYLCAARPGSLEAWFNHVDHVASVVGWEHLAIGSDWPIQAPAGVFERTFGSMLGALGFTTTAMSEQTLVDFTDFRDFPNVVYGLIRRGYSDAQIQGILGTNFLSVFEDVCD